jgi:hypothetical protein
MRLTLCAPMPSVGRQQAEFDLSWGVRVEPAAFWELSENLTPLARLYRVGA